jgi:hypothetical protein
MADTGVRTPPAPRALAAIKARVASLGSRPHRRGQAPSAELLRPVRPWTSLQRRMSPFRAPMLAQLAGGRCGGRTARGRPYRRPTRSSCRASQIEAPHRASSLRDRRRRLASCLRFPALRTMTTQKIAIDIPRAGIGAGEIIRAATGTMKAALQRRFATAAHSVHVDYGNR